jgi:prohibitin 1
VSSRIREDLLQRAGEFNIKLEDVSITHLTFGKVSHEIQYLMQFD